MNDGTSLYDVNPERLDQLVFKALQDSQGDDAPSKASLLEQVGSQIGCYKLLSILGEGGMGMVYLAQQEKPIKRKVALKVIKPGMDSKRVIIRFEAERQALALLDHPNIAHVYDAGTTESGRPYFVMEYVEGLSITEYCDHHKLTIEERLHLFVQICQAVHHAHQKGIIHRDIKPSNILVPLHGDQAVPRIIDFGVAKAIAQPLTQRTLTTEDSQLLGTPEYMSPEQADVGSEDIDTRSDIYSLGVLLYVLLTGVLPFDSDTLRTGGIEHIRQVIRQTDPKTPSTRLSCLKPEDCTQVARNRRADASLLRRKLSGDLDWIVMKCLEKNRMRRYESASELAMDLKRCLSNEPVVARPPTLGYRLQKSWRRNKVLYSSTAMVVIASVAGLIVAGAGWRQAMLARTNEASLRQQAEQQALVARRRAYASDMNLAQKALAENDRGRAVMLLDRQKPEPGQEDLRGWEWRYLWGQTRPNEHQVFFRGTKRLHGLEYSSDGRFLVWFAYSTGVYTEMSVTDLRTRQVVMSRTDCRRAAFARRNPWLVFAQEKEDQTDDIVFWDLDTGREIRRLPLGGADVSWLEFTPDDRLLVSLLYRASNMPGQSPWEWAVWESSTGAIQWRKLTKYPGSKARRRAAISPDGQLIAVSVGALGFLVFQTSDGSELFSVNGEKKLVQTLTFSPDGASLLSASGVESTAIHLWDVATGEWVRTLNGHRAYVTDLQFTTDGKYLISSSSDQTIRLWDWPEGRTVAVLHGHLDEVDGLAISPDGRSFASRCRDGSVFLWALDSPTRPPAYRTLMLRSPTWTPRPPVFTSDGRSIIAVDPNGTLAQWDIDTLQQVRRWRAGEDDGGYVAALTPDGTQAAIRDANGCISLLDLATGAQRTNVLPNVPSVYACYFSASGRYLVTHSSFDPIHETYQHTFWDLLSPSGSPHMTGRFQLPQGGLTFFNTLGTPSWGLHTEDAWVAGQYGKVQIHSLREPQAPPLTLLPGTRGARIHSFEVSPDGHLGAASYQEGYMRIWDLRSAERLRTMRVFLRSPHGIAFSPDGRRLAVGSHDREAVKLWETDTWQEVLTLAGEGTNFNMVAFSPDGRTLMAGNVQNQLHIWSAPSLEAIETAEAPPPQTQ